MLDRPGVLEVTREIVDAAGFADRVTLMPGDYLTTPFGSGFDAALLSGMMHRETERGRQPAAAQDVRRARARRPGHGQRRVLRRRRKNTPPFATSFALNMMLTSDHGSAHAKTEMARWMEANGFRNIAVHDMPQPNPHTLIIGFKP